MDGGLALVNIGIGLTVIVIVKGKPKHEPVVEVGVTIYSTVPDVVLLGLLSTWLIIGPVSSAIPVIPPVTFPITQLNVLGTLAVRTIFGDVLLQILVVGELVMTGKGLITITIVD